jgi:hypothetical protein
VQLFEELEVKHIHVFQFGCGGTGGWLVPPLSKFVGNLKLHHELETVSYILIDGDYVEEKNIVRQNFINTDLFRNKAQVLCERYAANLYSNSNKFINTFKYVPKFIKTGGMLKKIITEHIYQFLRSYLETTANNTTEHINMNIEDLIHSNFEKTLIILVGCVDDNKVRHLLYNFTVSNAKNIKNVPRIYFDSGNMENHGQIITTVSKNISKLTNYYNFKPKEFREDMFKINDNDNTSANNTTTVMRCEMFGDQTMGINMFGANMLYLMIQRLLLEKKLPLSKKINFSTSGVVLFE